MSDELTPGPLTSSGPIIIKTELPETLVIVTKIDGEELAAVQKRVQDEQDKLSYLTPDEKKDALEREAEVDELELEKKEREAGTSPLRLLAKYKLHAGIGVMLAAAGGLLIKGCL